MLEFSTEKNPQKQCEDCDLYALYISAKTLSKQHANTRLYRNTLGSSADFFL